MYTEDIVKVLRKQLLIEEARIRNLERCIQEDYEHMNNSVIGPDIYKVAIKQWQAYKDIHSSAAKIYISLIAKFQEK